MSEGDLLERIEALRQENERLRMTLEQHLKTIKVMAGRMKRLERANTTLQEMLKTAYAENERRSKGNADPPS